MKKVWFKTHPELLEKLKEDISSDFPNLNVYVEGDTVFVRGDFPIKYEDTIPDRYKIEIEVPYDYPDSIPVVRDIGGRIPRTPEFHMFSDGRCCLFVPDAKEEVLPKGSSFLDFLNGPVRNFFLGQALVFRGQPWPFGERAHGLNGIMEYLTELVGTPDLQTIVNYLNYMSRPNVKGHWPCPCGSGKCLRNCHFKHLLQLREKKSPQESRKSLFRILNFLNRFEQDSSRK